MKKSESMGFFNDYAIANNEMHPIGKLLYEAGLECEKLPASEQQTKTVIAIGKCRDAVEKELQAISEPAICEIDFGGAFKCQVELRGGEIKILKAVDGYGNKVDPSEIQIHH